MIPLELTLQGFYSYREKVTIDFSPLIEAGLFGIFGKVGSGKSSIIDAMVFALYDQSDRLSSNEKKHYMHVSAREMVVDFRFKTESSVYRYLVYGKRGAGIHAAPRYQRSSYRLEGEEWIPLSDSRDNTTLQASELLGLSYDNFRRAVVIPQGTFQEFLRLTGKKRTEMLQELFRLDRFDLFQPVKKLLNATNQQLDITVEQKKGLDQDQLPGSCELAREIEKKSGEAEALDGRVLSIRQEQTKLQDSRKRKDQQLRLEEEVMSLEKEKSLWEKRKEELSRYHAVVSRLKPLYEEIADRRKQLGLHKDRLKAGEEKLSALKEQVNLSEQRYQECSLEVENRSRTEKELRELKHLADIHDLKRELENRQKQVHCSHEKEQKLQNTLSEKKIQRKDLREELNTLPVSIEEEALLEEIEQWYRQEQQIERDLFLVRQEIAEKEVLHDELLLPFCRRTEKAGDESFAFLLNFLEGQRAELNDALYNRGVEAYRSRLVPGIPCPVCGSPDHPAAAEPGSGKNSEEPEREESLLKALKDIETEILQLGHAQSRSDLLQEQIRALESRAVTLEKARNSHLERFRWSDLDSKDPGSLQRKKEESRQRKEKERSLRKELDRLEEALEILEQDHSRLKVDTLEQEKQLITVSADYEALEKQIDDDLLIKWQDCPETDIETRIKELEGSLGGVMERYRKAEKERGLLKTEMGALQGELKELGRWAEESESILEDKYSLLYPLLEEFNFSSEEELSAYLGSDYDARREQEALEHYERELHLLAGQLRKIRQAEKEDPFDQRRWEEIEWELPEAEREQKAFWQELARLKEQYQLALRREDMLKKLAGRLKELQKRAEALSTLSAMMKGNGFVRFISIRYLKELCVRANERFFILSGKSLALEVDDDGDFQIRDYLNGGELRSVRTLSGGQTFQAAFSLAIALSESVQRGGESFFFLDEGFGSLDRDSLSLVFDTLKSLRKERRIAGVISHVESLQEEIETALVVKHDPKRGSVVQLLTDQQDNEEVHKL
jgi:DNA repair protein SbcC/Rad50